MRYTKPLRDMDTAGFPKLNCPDLTSNSEQMLPDHIVQVKVAC
jgi:hypothetical protein